MSRLASVPQVALAPLGTAARTAARSAADRVQRALLRRSHPPVERAELDGGRADHPLGLPDLPTPGPGGAAASMPPGGLAELGPAALAAGRGDPEGLREVLAWIAADRPGEGPAWQDPAQVACRLLHLAATWVWTRPDPAAAAAIGGSAQAHGRWLDRERPLHGGDPARVLSDAARFVAGLAWPALPEARGWQGEAMAELRRAAPTLLGSDGAPLAEPAQVARALWALALARAWAHAAGVGVPPQVNAALVQGSTSLWRLAGDSGVLPGSEPPPPALLPLSSQPLAHSLRDLVLAWELDAGELATGDDPAVRRLAGADATGPWEAMALDGEWRMWSWRGTGLAVVHARLKGLLSRGWVRQQDGHVQWDLADQALVWSTRAPAAMVVARVDGSKARIITVPPGSDAHADDRAEREILFRQARLVVTDRGVDQVRWQLGAGWSLEPGDKGEYTATRDGVTLVAKFDEGEGWTWTVQGDRVEGRGDPAVAVRSSFELR